MPVRRVLLGVLTVLLGGCASAPDSIAPTCTSDDECATGQVCFADGCGDPGRNVVVEISGDLLAGQYAQDFAIPDGGVSATMSFTLPSAVQLVGEFQRELGPLPDPSNRALYTDAVLVRAVGESALIPGVARSYETRFDSTERGVFSMSLGAGNFTVTALAGDTSIPPATTSDVTLGAGQTAGLNFVFPSVDGAVTVSGRLLKERVAGTPPTDYALTQAAMDLQAFDPSTRSAVSQRIAVSSGTAASKGDFILTMAPGVRDASSITLQASPRDSTAVVPTKTFTLSAPLSNSLTLEMGDFGDSLPQVQGQLLAPDGTPSVGTQVVIEGQVNGGGTFRSKVTSTDAAGRFALDLLANADATPFVLTAVPPPGSPAATTRAEVRASTGAAPLTLTPAIITLAARIPVSATVLRPDGTPATHIGVRAVAQTGLTERPIPLEDVTGTTDELGQFSLQLDPGTWEFDFFPGADLPRASRRVTVRAGVDAQGNAITSQALPPFTLPRGRKVTGVVHSTDQVRSIGTVPYATVRFFRVMVNIPVF